MNKRGQYFLTGLLAIVLAIAPLRAVLALPMLFEDHCVSVTDHDNHLPQTGQASLDLDNNPCNQAHDPGCCDDKESSCTTDCHAGTSLSFALMTTLSAKTVREILSSFDFITSTVPMRNLAPLLRPPATLHS